ncbi:hypothetical protein QVD17_27124 [Tagetes erecta]|uniref:Uncharacterized protein n=1 Tax=Tagetes erecta TaxID=13708 RepID=A0AAD8K8J2_TARER|nr:hypothetical protein QVD17_27124 [Tagetes erecta]
MDEIGFSYQKHGKVGIGTESICTESSLSDVVSLSLAHTHLFIHVNVLDIIIVNHYITLFHSFIHFFPPFQISTFYSSFQLQISYKSFFLSFIRNSSSAVV